MTDSISIQFCAPGSAYMIREADKSDDFAEPRTKDDEYLRSLATEIEKERGKISSLPLDSLSSQGTILRLNELERMINEYINLVIRKIR